MRKSLCFSRAYNTTRRPPQLICEQPFKINETKAMCCCSVVGRAWGDPCEPCPAHKTGMSIFLPILFLILCFLSLNLRQVIL